MVIVIFGASGGIGSAVASALQENNTLVLVSRHLERNTFGKMITWNADITDKKQIDDALSSTQHLVGDIDAVINCVGIPMASRVDQMTLSDIKGVFDTNFFGAVQLVQSAMNFLRDTGHIITIGSLRAFEHGATKSAYCASKAALDMFLKCFRMEVPEGIRVSVVHPGFVDTDWYGEESKIPYVRNEDGEYISMKVTQPEDVAEAVRYLLYSPPTSKINEIRMGEVLGERKDVWLL